MGRRHAFLRLIAAAALRLAAAPLPGADGRANATPQFLRGPAAPVAASRPSYARAQRDFFAAFGFLDDEGWTPPPDDAVPAAAAVALRDDAATAGGYAYRLTPCVGRLSRRADAAGGAPHYETDALCRRGAQQIGVGGSWSACTRAMLDVAVQFALPQVDPDRVVAVALNVTVSGSSGGGLAVALRGLPVEDAAGETYALDAATDHYGGDPAAAAAASQLAVTDAFAPAGLPAGTVASSAPAALLAYVRDALRPDGPLRRGALVLGPAATYGCDAACDAGCAVKRYFADAADVALTLTVAADAPAPTSAWVRREGERGLRYKASAEPETLG